MSINTANSIGLMRELVGNYNHREIERCIENQINIGCNVCLKTTNGHDAMNILARAGFMHSLMNDGCSMKDALRELGKRMRVYN